MLYLGGRHLLVDQTLNAGHQRSLAFGGAAFGGCARGLGTLVQCGQRARLRLATKMRAGGSSGLGCQSIHTYTSVEVGSNASRTHIGCCVVGGQMPIKLTISYAPVTQIR